MKQEIDELKTLDSLPTLLVLSDSVNSENLKFII